MKRRIVVYGLMTLVAMGLAGTIAMAARSQTDSLPESELVSLIADPRTLDVVRCDLENGRWGEYDTRIYVEETRDRKARMFNLSKGRLSTQLVPAKPSWVIWGSPQQQRDGKVTMASADEAFAKGVPFYISAEYQPPVTLRVTVVSNSSKPIDRATLFTSWDSPAGAGTMKDSGRLRSTAQPQTVLVKHEGFKDTAAINVWLRKGEINESNPFADVPHCLISNEVEVRK